MSFATILLAEAATHTELPMPSWMYGVIALIVFLFLAVTTFSYRDVANRHSASASAKAAAEPGHGH
jgi:protein-S-isoprenylcysteine O-methyltransferase Ste14